MIANYSASKRRSVRPIQIEDVIRTSRGAQYRPNLYDNYPYDSNTNIITNQRSSSAMKKRYQDQNKQNYNTQSRQDKRIIPIHSPLKQPLYSPLKNDNNYQSLKTKQNLTQGNIKRKLNMEEAQNISYDQKYIPRKNQYNNFGYSSYRNVNQSRNQICYDVQYRNQDNDFAVNIEQPISARQNKNTNMNNTNTNLAVTFSNRSNSPYISKNITPQKHNPHMEVDQLVEKSQFLKQRIDRISRMTPKSSNRTINFPKQQVTPQKIAPPSITVPQQQVNQIVKYNKYCDQKLPLQTIYDAEQTRNDYHCRQQTQQVQQGIQKINCLSKKISERLKNIISRHSK